MSGLFKSLLVCTLAAVFVATEAFADEKRIITVYYGSDYSEELMLSGTKAVASECSIELVSKPEFKNGIAVVYKRTMLKAANFSDALLDSRDFCREDQGRPSTD